MGGDTESWTTACNALSFQTKSAVGGATRMPDPVVVIELLFRLFNLLY